jgi:hypothetical protein
MLRSRRLTKGANFLLLIVLSSAPSIKVTTASSVRPGTHVPADVHNLVIQSRWRIIEQRQVHHDFASFSSR